MFSFTNGQEPIIDQTTEGCSIEFIGHRMPWQDRNSCTTQCYSQGINQQNRVRLFQYSDWLAIITFFFFFSGNPAKKTASVHQSHQRLTTMTLKTMCRWPNQQRTSKWWAVLVQSQMMISAISWGILGHKNRKARLTKMLRGSWREVYRPRLRRHVRDHRAT